MFFTFIEIFLKDCPKSPLLLLWSFFFFFVVIVRSFFLVLLCICLKIIIISHNFSLSMGLALLWNIAIITRNWASLAVLAALFRKEGLLHISNRSVYIMSLYNHLYIIYMFHFFFFLFLSNCMISYLVYKSRLSSKCFLQNWFFSEFVRIVIPDFFKALLLSILNCILLCFSGQLTTSSKSFWLWSSSSVCLQPL